MDSFEDLRPTVAIPTVIFIIYCVYLLFIKSYTVPRNLPWAGRKAGLFANFRANVAGTLNPLPIFKDGYTKWTKNGQYWIAPNLLAGPYVILGHKDVKWLLSQPESVLDSYGPIRELLASDYTMEMSILGNNDHVAVIRRDLTRELASLAGVVADEVSHSLEESWGSDSEAWKEIVVYTSMMDIATHAVNRLLIGSPLCRDSEFTSVCYSFVQTLAGSMTVLRAVPEWMKPFVGPIATLPRKWYGRKYQKLVKPVVQARLSGREEGNDMLQWLIRAAAPKRTTDPKALTLSHLAVRLSTIDFAAIHTTTFSGMHALYDLAASPRSREYVDIIRDECEKALGSPKKWTKEAIDKMYALDSALRESQRINSLSLCSIRRRVSARGGVTLPDGSHAPKGTGLAIGTLMISEDDSLFDDPLVYDPLRFSRVRLSGNAPKEDLAATAATDRNYVWSQGKHACPGRFFAIQELKIIFAHILLDYDIEPLPERPANFWFLDFTTPPMTGSIRVKRRKVRK